MIDVVAYPRASSLSQLDGFGLEAQERTIREYCENHDMRVIEVFPEKAVRGKTEYDDREAFMAMLAYIEKNNIKHVIVAKLDRIARDLIVQETIIRDLARAGVKLLSVAEPDLNSDDETRVLFRRIVGAIAEWDAIRISKRLKSGRIERAHKGDRACGAIPYGYRSENKVTIIDEIEASVIRRIFASRASKSLQAIADELNAERVPTPGRSEIWRAGTIHSILHNPIYRGVVSYDVDGRTVEATNESLRIVS